MTFIYQLIHKSNFPKITSVQNELQKIDLLRFGIGIILFIRVLEIAYAMSVFNNEVSLKVTIILLLIVLFTIGFFTPIVSLSLLISMRWLDSYAHTTTLGTTILVHLLILIFLSNSGQHYSVDSILLKTKKIYYPNV